MRSPRDARLTRVAWLLLGLMLVLSLGVVEAFADDTTEPVAAEESEKDAVDDQDLSLSDLEARITSNPRTALLVVLVRFIPIGIGIILLVLLYLEADRRRGGKRRPLVPTPPPRIGDVGFAVGACAVVMLGVPILVSIVWGASVEPDVAKQGLPMQYSMATLAFGGLALSSLVILRRARLAKPTRPGGLWKGLGAFCIASVFVLPALFLTLILMEMLGDKGTAQDLVKKAIFGDESTFWLIAIYGVFLAPLIEECMFRGLLYPAIRDSLGGGRKGIIGSALITSVVFSAIHGSMTAFLPLFCLAMVLALVIERTNSLLAVTVAHMTNNFLSFVPMFLLRQGA